MITFVVSHIIKVNIIQNFGFTLISTELIGIDFSL